MRSRLFMVKAVRLLPVPSQEIFLLTCLLAALAMRSSGRAAPTPSTNDLPAAASRPIDFAKDIQPIFAGHCYDCHGPKKQEAQFRLDSKAVALQGGELGPAIVPGKS